MNNTTAFIPQTFRRQQDYCILQDIATLIWMPLDTILNNFSWEPLQNISMADNIFITGIFFLIVAKRWNDFRNEITCKVTAYVNVGYLSTGLILASAATERFLAIAFPLKFRTWTSRLKTSKIALNLLFIFSFTISIVCTVTSEFSQNQKLCLSNDKLQQLASTMFLIIHVIISQRLCGGIILIFTIVIIIFLFRQKRNRNQMTHSSNSQKEFQIAVMLVTVTCLFIILRLPGLI